MIAPRIENPEGTLQKTLAIQDHPITGAQGKVDPEHWDCFMDGVPRRGAFKKRSFPSKDTIESQ
eukprot:3484597-Alexandrium_andersonii.AAC.1